MRPQPASRSYLSATFCVAFLGSVLSLYPLIGLGSNYLLQAVQHNMFLAAVALAGSLAASLASGRTAYGITAASRVMIILLVPGSKHHWIGSRKTLESLLPVCITD